METELTRSLAGGLTFERSDNQILVTGGRSPWRHHLRSPDRQITRLPRSLLPTAGLLPVNRLVNHSAPGSRRNKCPDFNPFCT